MVLPKTSFEVHGKDLPGEYLLDIHTTEVQCMINNYK